MAGGCGGRGQSLFRWWGERLSVDAGHGHAVHWQWLKDNGVDVDGLATMAAAGGISDAGNAVAGSLADGRVRSAEWQARRYHCRNLRPRLPGSSALPTPPAQALPMRFPPTLEVKVAGHARSKKGHSSLKKSLITCASALSLLITGPLASAASGIVVLGGDTGVGVSSVIGMSNDGDVMVGNGSPGYVTADQS